MGKSKEHQNMITFRLVEKDMNKYENHRSFSSANSTNVDTTDMINDVMRKHKAAWNVLAK
ncbi:MAG: hypothetical protein EOM45_08240 [Clostridia bacterium]|nr:hypothetical protein [Clostridia bacterium]